MKRIKLTTAIDGDVIGNFELLDKKLFKKLTPPLMKLSIARFDGKAIGDEIHLQINSPLMPVQDWVSLVSESKIDPNESFFVDIGKKLPWPLRQWSHRHVIFKREGQTYILDDIEFGCGKGLFNNILELIYYPVFLLMFLMRKPIYRSYFAQSISNR